MNGYEPARAVAAEGARVGLVVCQRCGAALVLDIAVPFDVMERHTAWHAAILSGADLDVGGQGVEGGATT